MEESSSYHLLHKSRTIVWLHPEYLEGFFVFRELLQIFLCQGFLDVFLVDRINKCDTGTFETCSRETATIHTLHTSHYLIDGNEFWAATLVIVNTALTACERELAKEL